MKKLFLSALIIAGATASFAQAQNTASQPVKRNTPPNLREAQAAKTNSQVNQAAPANTAKTSATTTTKATTKTTTQTKSK